MTWRRTDRVDAKGKLSFGKMDTFQRYSHTNKRITIYEDDEVIGEMTAQFDNRIKTKGPDSWEISSEGIDLNDFSEDDENFWLMRNTVIGTAAQIKKRIKEGQAAQMAPKARGRARKPRRGRRGRRR